MDKNALLQQAYFDALAPDWRKGSEVDDKTFDDLFFHFSFDGCDVLDVGCGVGVLTEYLAKRCRFVSAIDVSTKMIERAKREVCYSNVTFSVADFYEYTGSFDRIFVFDAYPHFPDKERFALHAFDLLKPGGELYVAFDESREKIDAHHRGSAAAVSVGLRSPIVEAEPYLSAFSVLRTRDDEKYLLALKKKG